MLQPSIIDVPSDRELKENNSTGQLREVRMKKVIQEYCGRDLWMDPNGFD